MNVNSSIWGKSAEVYGEFTVLNAISTSTGVVHLTNIYQAYRPTYDHHCVCVDQHGISVGRVDIRADGRVMVYGNLSSGTKYLFSIGYVI